MCSGPLWISCVLRYAPSFEPLKLQFVDAHALVMSFMASGDAASARTLALNLSKHPGFNAPRGSTETPLESLCCSRLARRVQRRALGEPSVLCVVARHPNEIRSSAQDWVVHHRAATDGGQFSEDSGGAYFSVRQLRDDHEWETLSDRRRRPSKQ